MNYSKEEENHNCRSYKWKYSYVFSWYMNSFCYNNRPKGIIHYPYYAHNKHNSYGKNAAPNPNI